MMFFKIALSTILPKLLGDTYDYLAGMFNDPPEQPKSLDIPAQDKTKFTQEMYTYAKKEYIMWRTKGATSTGVLIYTHIEFVAHLNKVFGTRKSVSSMRRLYKGGVNKEGLPSSGIKY